MGTAPTVSELEVLDAAVGADPADGVRLLAGEPEGLAVGVEAESVRTGVDRGDPFLYGKPHVDSLVDIAALVEPDHEPGRLERDPQLPFSIEDDPVGMAHRSRREERGLSVQAHAGHMVIRPSGDPEEPAVLGEHELVRGPLVLLLGLVHDVHFRVRVTPPRGRLRPVQLELAHLPRLIGPTPADRAQGHSDRRNEDMTKHSHPGHHSLLPQHFETKNRRQFLFQC